MYATIDIGGTKTLVAVFNSEGSVIEQVKFPTPPEYPAFLVQLDETIKGLSTKDFQAAAVAAPGKIDHLAGTLVAAGNLTWHNISLQADIEKLLKTPVILENDAKAATVAEAKAAGSAFKKVVYITISTGIGIGVCMDGQLVPELEGAEAGWMDIEHDGKMVPWEKIASGQALFKKYGVRASDLEDSASWDEHARNIAKGLITIIAIVQPDLIVFGGGVGNHLDKYQAPLLKYLKLYENPLVPIPPIRKAAHPEEAVIYGCYEIAKANYGQHAH